MYEGAQISRRPSYFNHLFLRMSDEIQSRIAIAKAAGKKKK
jgi:hypothetical protein